MEKICVFADVHHDLDVLKKLFKCEDFLTADQIIFLGDVLCGRDNDANMCVEFLKKQNKCKCLLGNNDLYVAKCLKNVNLEFFSPLKIDRIIEINKTFKTENIEWVMSLDREYFYKDCLFCHYAWEDDKNDIVKEHEILSLNECEEIFKNKKQKHIIFAHKHDPYFFDNKKQDFLCVASASKMQNHATKGVGEYVVLSFDDKKLIKVERKNIL